MAGRVKGGVGGVCARMCARACVRVHTSGVARGACMCAFVWHREDASLKW